jgi:hypothetical protein
VLEGVALGGRNEQIDESAAVRRDELAHEWGSGVVGSNACNDRRRAVGRIRAALINRRQPVRGFPAPAASCPRSGRVR